MLFRSSQTRSLRSNPIHGIPSDDHRGVSSVQSAARTHGADVGSRSAFGAPSSLRTSSETHTSARQPFGSSFEERRMAALGGLESQRRAPLLRALKDSRGAGAARSPHEGRLRDRTARSNERRQRPAMKGRSVGRRVRRAQARRHTRPGDRGPESPIADMVSSSPTGASTSG